MAYTDSFTDADSTGLEDHGVWEYCTGAYAQVIMSNQLFGNSSGAGYYYNQSFASAHYAKAKYISASAGEFNGPAVRVQTSNNYYQCLAGSGHVYPGQNIDGSLSDWDAGQDAVNANDVVEFSIDPSTTTTVYYKVNGSIVETYTGKDTLSGGRAGVACYNGGIIDDWEGGDLEEGNPAVSASENISVVDTPTVVLVDEYEIYASETVGVVDIPIVHLSLLLISVTDIIVVGVANFYGWGELDITVQSDLALGESTSQLATIDVIEADDVTVGETQAFRIDLLASAISDIAIGEASTAQLVAPVALNTVATDTLEVADLPGLTNPNIYLAVTSNITVDELLNTSSSDLLLFPEDGLAVGDQAVVAVSSLLPVVTSNITLGDQASVALVEAEVIQIQKTDGIMTGETKTIELVLPTALEVAASQEDLILAEVPVILIPEYMLEVTDEVATAELLTITNPQPGEIGISSGDGITAGESLTISTSALFISSSDDLTVDEQVAANTTVRVDVQEDLTVGESKQVIISACSLACESSIEVADNLAIQLVAPEDILISAQDDLTLAEPLVPLVPIVPLVSTSDVTVGESLAITNPLPIAHSITTQSDLSVGEELSSITSGLETSVTNNLVLEEVHSQVVSAPQISRGEDLIVGESNTVTIGATSTLDIQISSDLIVGELAQPELLAPIPLEAIATDGLTISDQATIQDPALLAAAQDDLSLADITNIFIPIPGATEINVSELISLGEQNQQSTSALLLGLTDEVAIGEEILAFTTIETFLQDDLGLEDTAQVAPIVGVLSVQSILETGDLATVELVEPGLIAIQVSDDLVVDDVPEVVLQDLSVAISNNLLVYDSPIVLDSDLFLSQTEDLSLSDLAEIGTLQIDLQVSDDLTVEENQQLEISGLLVSNSDGLVLSDPAVVTVSVLVIDELDGLVVAEALQLEIPNLYVGIVDDLTIGDLPELQLSEPTTEGIVVADDLVTGDIAQVENNALIAEAQDGLILAEVPIVSVPEPGATPVVASDIVSVGEQLTIQASDLSTISDDSIDTQDGISVVLVAPLPELPSVIDDITVGDLADITISALQARVTDDLTVGETEQITNPLPTALQATALSDIIVSDAPEIAVGTIPTVDISITSDVTTTDQASLIVSALRIEAIDELVVGEVVNAFVGVVGVFYVSEGDIINIAEEIVTQVGEIPLINLEQSDQVTVAETFEISLALNISTLDNLAVDDTVELPALPIALSHTDNLVLGQVVSISCSDLQLLACEDITVSETHDLLIALYWNVIEREVLYKSRLEFTVTYDSVSSRNVTVELGLEKNLLT